MRWPLLPAANALSAVLFGLLALLVDRRFPLSTEVPRRVREHPRGRATRSRPSCPTPTISRRRVLVLDVTQAAAEVSRLVREAYDLNLPVEPGVRDGRNALVRWAVLLEEVLP